MALKDSWQQQRQQRQQEATQRRRQVSETLVSTQKERQASASALRRDLSRVRVTLASADRDRAVEFQRFSVELQQHCMERHLQTQDFLISVSDRRHSQAQQTARQLREFVQAIQGQTADFLTVTEADRQVMAQQLANDLQTFRAVLDETVNALRQEIQAEIQDLQLETHSLLSQGRQQRLKIQIRLTRTLAAFTENLQLEVHHYLSDVQTARHEQAARLAQTLTQSRLDREVENCALFARLADFRSQLCDYRAELKNTIWGEDSSARESVTSHLVVRQPSPVLNAAPTRPAPMISVPTRAIAHKTVPKPASRPDAQTPQNAPSVEVKPAAKAGGDQTFEEKVYQYIELMQGVRLTEIESAMGISRFQVVDTLRSLLQKGLVTQRDRVYRIQEDFVV